MPNAAPNYRWDHIHLRSPDPDATAAWFERILGAQVIRSTVEGKPRIDLKLGGADVFIMPVVPGDNVNPPPVTVSGIDAVAAELKAKGVEFTMEPRTIRPGLRICFLRGPQGISIELLERDQKYA
jgi:lactoylglutathione lyase